MSGNTLADAAALVTGASAGIGRATARRLARAGADVALAARREERLEELAADLRADHGVEAVVAPTDVTDRAAVEATVEATVEAFGGLDLVVNNAGTNTARGHDVDDLPVEQYRQVMAVNVDGMYYVTRATLPHLRASEGTLVFVGSVAAKFPYPGGPVYGASKWWTRGFALSLAGQVGEDGVAVTVVNPGAVRTEIGREFRPREELPAERYEPGERIEPAEVADAVAFAAAQEPPNAVAELDLFGRDRLSRF